MGDGTAYDGELFIHAVEKGLKLLNPTAALQQSSSSSYQSAIPTAPMLYAEVAANVAGAGTPALVPLQLQRVSVKVLAEANIDPCPSYICVRFNATWIVEDQYEGYALILAVPVGLRGTLVRCEMEVAGIGEIRLHKDELANCRRQSNNVYLVSLPSVKIPLKGGTLARVAVSYLQDFSTIDKKQELYSFCVPLSIPGYVTSTREERFQNEKIRVIFEHRGPGSIKDCVITSHPMIGIINGEKKQVFLQESDGYSNKDLECSFRECLFVEAVEEGLRLICCPKGMSSGLHTLLPTAPVLYAVVSNIDILDTKAASADLSFHLPALVPLQMTWLSVKVNAEPKPDSVHVHFKGKWSVHCIKEGNSGALVLAVPVGHRMCSRQSSLLKCRVSGAPRLELYYRENLCTSEDLCWWDLRGCLLQYEIQVSSHGQTVKTEEFPASSDPQFQNIYFVPLPLVDGGADVCVQCHYSQDVFLQNGVFSFSVPLSVPSYVSQTSGKSLRKGRIKLTLECKDAGIITECDVPSHHMKELILHERMRVFQQELLSYSSKDLACSFRVEATSGTSPVEVSSR